MKIIRCAHSHEFKNMLLLFTCWLHHIILESLHWNLCWILYIKKKKTTTLIQDYIFKNFAHFSFFHHQLTQCCHVDGETGDFGLWTGTSNNLLSRLLIGQRGFTVRDIPPPIGLACSCQGFIACFCIFVWTRFLFLKWRKNVDYKNNRVRMDYA